MKHKQLFLGVGSALAMLVLILDGKTALAGAQQGVQLCLRTVVPSLFPFFFLTNLLTSSLAGVSSRALRPLGKLFGVPEGTEPLLLAGLLGGYPAGAQSIAQSYRAGRISRQEGERLLAFCNQPGPAFLFGMVGFLFPRKWMVWLLWVIILLSALVTARFVGDTPGKAIAIPAKKPSSPLAAALRATGTVCGWVVIFRVILAFLSRWFLWLVPAEGQALLTGLLELTNGCLLLGNVPDIRLRFVLAAGLLTFGGLCVGLQTISILDGLSFRNYLIGKLLQTAIVLSLALAATWGIWLPVAVLFLLFALVQQKRGSIPKEAGV